MIGSTKMVKIHTKSAYKQLFQKTNIKLFTKLRSLFIRKFQKNFHGILASALPVLAINPGVDINFDKIFGQKSLQSETTALAG